MHVTERKEAFEYQWALEMSIIVRLEHNVFKINIQIKYSAPLVAIYCLFFYTYRLHFKHFFYSYDWQSKSLTNVSFISLHAYSDHMHLL